MTVIAIRAKNPLNIRPLPNGQQWNGQIGVEAPGRGGYCKFGDWAYGIRACVKQLLAYQRKRGLRTIQGIINTWAPASDNNHVANYVSRVSRLSGFSGEETLDLEDMETMNAIFHAMARVEIGLSDTATFPWPDDKFWQGMELAGYDDVPQHMVNTAPPAAPMTGGQRTGVTVGVGVAATAGALATEASEAYSKVEPIIAGAGDLGKYIGLAVAVLLVGLLVWKFVLPRLRRT